MVQNGNKSDPKYVMSASRYRFEALRQQIRILECQSLLTAGHGVLPLTDRRLNAPLPRGGLQLGALHEICADGLETEIAPAMTAFAAMLAAQILRGSEGYVLWAASRADCYMPGLIRFGLDPSRVLWADCAKDAEVPGVMEEALHSKALAAVVGEAGSLTLKTGRRLDAAARQSGTTALLLRRHRSKPSKLADSPSGAAATRWHVSALPSEASSPPHPVLLPKGRRDAVAPSSLKEKTFLLTPSPLGERAGVRGDLVPGLGPPRWRLGLDYCRNGRTASWIVEACGDANGDKKQASHVRVVAELRDNARAPEEPGARQAPRTARLA
jgi:hypothetical protein